MQIEKNLENEISKTISNYIGIEYEEEINEEEICEEDNDEKKDGERPFDADKIRIDQQMLSLKYIFELMEGELIETNPSFQRNSVWKENKRKSSLIESLMLRIPIPAFYFYENEDAQFQVIDGQQRLLTIHDFLKGKFKLSGLEYLGKSCNKKRFEDLDIKYQQRIFRTQLAVNILDARSPKRVIYDIFRRINTGGLSLNPQEMRNAICTKRVREFLLKGTKNEIYILATRGKIKDNRMDSQELVLRFFAFYNIYDYESEKITYNYSNTSGMLDDAIEVMNKMSEYALTEIEKKFTVAMNRSYSLFGEYCFSKIYITDSGEIGRNKDLINKSLFSSFSVLLANPKYDNIDFTLYKNIALRSLADELCNNDYSNALSMGTGDKKRVIDNFNYSNEVIKKCKIQL